MFLTYAWGAPPTVLHPHWGLARLGDSPSCRAQLSLNSTNTHACLSSTLWSRELDEGRWSRSCSEWQGNWKLFSPPLNSDAGHSKVILKKFAAVNCVAWRSLQFSEVIRNGIERTRLVVSELFAPFDELGIVRALVLGERTREHRDLHALLYLLGFVHMLSATGIHLYALQTGAQWGVVQIARRMELRSDWVIRAARFLSVFLWGLAWCLGGARAGMLRPLLVVSLRSLGSWVGMKWRWWAPLFLSLSIDGIVACFRGGGWGRFHYALAVGGGLIAMNRNRQNGFSAHLTMALGSWVLVALSCTLTEGLVAPWTPVLSILTIPVFALGVFPGVLVALGLKVLGQVHLANALARMISFCVNHALHLLGAALMRMSPLWLVSWPSLLLAMVLALFVFRPKTGLLLLTLLLAVRLSWSALESIRVSSLSMANVIIQLDVGQGDSALVVSPRSVGLIDTGSSRALGSVDWISILARQGVERLDWVGLTHLDQDHVGGLDILLRIVKIGRVMSSSEELETERGMALKKKLNEGGTRVSGWVRGDYPFSVLGPDLSIAAHSKGNTNMSALLVPMQKGGAYLSMGDADELQEVRFATWARRLEPGPIVLKVSHHGSRFSSSPKILELIKPVEAWISDGVGNTYGHPSPIVLENLKKAGIPVHRTDQEGALRLRP